jgi:SlyX protein
MQAQTQVTALEERVVELETRLAFQEQSHQQLSDAMAALREESARAQRLLRMALEELRHQRGALMGDSADEPPPPHY